MLPQHALLNTHNFITHLEHSIHLSPALRSHRSLSLSLSPAGKLQLHFRSKTFTNQTRSVTDAWLPFHRHTVLICMYIAASVCLPVCLFDSDRRRQQTMLLRSSCTGYFACRKRFIAAITASTAISPLTLCCLCRCCIIPLLHFHLDTCGMRHFTGSSS